MRNKYFSSEIWNPTNKNGGLTIYICRLDGAPRGV